MDRSHPSYLVIAIIVAAGLQLLLVWKLRSGVKEIAPEQPHGDRGDREAE